MISRFRTVKFALKLVFPLARFFDLLFSPVTFLGSLWFRVIRYWGIKNLPITKRVLLRLGVYPLVDHYYDPLFDYRKLRPSSEPGRSSVENIEKQIALIKQFNYAAELRLFPKTEDSKDKYYYNNGSFGSGDAELYYSMIRSRKPKHIIEIGSGFSTLMALNAVQKNNLENEQYQCIITCIEPYEMPWLEKLNIKVIRKKVEELDINFFDVLSEDDILFVDSSHIIRPGGDVLFIILKVLPALNKGVLVHFHDIFIPYEYPVEWLRDEFRMWNEQYLLEAFLKENKTYETLVALHFLNRNYKDQIFQSFPALAVDKDRQPGSFWIQKIA